MKRVYVLLPFLLCMVICSHAQRLAFDSKYVKVGIMSNEWPTALSANPNLLPLGNLPSSFTYQVEKWESGKVTEQRLNESRIGKKVLDCLFQRDTKGLHMDWLYEQALQNTTVAEIEVALKDISAETNDVLKREVAHQLLKNNYIVVFQTVTKHKNNRTVKVKKHWSVFHVEIDDRIIEQAYANWQTPATYDQINVPVKFVAEGKVPKSADENELVYDIAKKVPAFAVRGPVISRYPFLAQIGEKMGVKNSGRIYIYRFKQSTRGDIYSKKVCTTRATTVSNDTTRMYMISGSFPSTKKGDVAVLKDRHRSAISLLGQGSFGDDARIGGRFQYDYLLNFSKDGIAQYLIAATGYNRYKKEPKGIWWDESKGIQPTLNNIDFSFGYGVGFNFLGRFELMPYILAGMQYSYVSDGDTMYYWDNKQEQWPKLIDSNDHLSYFGFVGHAGTRLCMNLWYPLQLYLGADYNYSTKSSSLEPLLSRHTLSRVNLYAGLRLQF